MPMGKANRPRPERLAEKLLTIRQKIDGGLSQNEMLRKLGLEDDLERDRVSKYERDTLEPPLYVLLRYAEAANVYLEAIVDDRIDLPETLPSRKKSEGIKRQK
jgi:transcriptional regulator with XRE-family HTH domain